MAHPALAVPVLTTNVVGWAVLGTVGFLTYKAGKKPVRHLRKALTNPHSPTAP